MVSVLAQLDRIHRDSMIDLCCSLPCREKEPNKGVRWPSSTTASQKLVMIEQEISSTTGNVTESVSSRTKPIEFDDETLRDGLQSPSVVDPPIEKKLEILRLMDRLGIHTANVGLPGAGPRAVEDVTRLCQLIVDEKLSIVPNCAARTHENDIRAVAEISQKVGISHRMLHLHRIESHPTVHRGLDPRTDAGSYARRFRSLSQRGTPSDVRHRGHDPRSPRDTESTLHHRHRARRSPRLRV